MRECGLRIALDATYSIGRELSGVGVYCREILWGLPPQHPDSRFQFCYRPHRFLRSLRERLPPNCSRFPLHDDWLAPSADVFHGLNQRLPRRRMKNAVTTFHDLFVMTGEYSTADFRRRFTQQAREAAEKSDLIITVSKFTAEQVRQLLNVEESRLRVIHHGVHPPPAGFRRKPENLILHVGAVQKRKNISRLVTAFEWLPAHWSMVLAGSHGYGAEEIVAQIGRSPASSRIRLTGYVNADALDALYSRAALVAFPSLDEGFGMPVLEAMARGIPVLTSNGSALKEVSGSAAMLVDPESVESIAQGLSALVHHEGLRSRLSEEGLLRAAEFPWKAAVDRTWSVYRELVP